MDTVLITGATGFLGGTLARSFLALGIKVVATGRDVVRLEALKQAGAHTLQADLSDVASVMAFTDGTLPPIKTIVHAAALASPWGSYRAFEAANVMATKTIVQIARELGVKRFVLISSPAVYFRHGDQDRMTEDHPLPTPINAYAATKRAAEEIVLAARELGPIVLRPHGLYGSGDTALLPRLMRAMERGRLPLLRNGNAKTDLTHIDDVVRAIEAAIVASKDAEGEIFNVSSGDPHSTKTIIEAVCAYRGITPRWRALPVAPLLSVVRALETVHALWPGRPEPFVTCYTLGLLAYTHTLDITKAARLLNWTPSVTLDEGLFRTFGPIRGAT